MFWRFGGYANVSTIDTILERDNFELEELLDESDLVQELKQHNARLVEYLRDPQVLEKLLRYVVAPKLEPVASPDDEEEDEDGDEKAKNALRASTASEGSSRADDTSREDREKKRNRYALVSTEILSSDTWSMYDALMESKPLLRDFWQFLKRDAPLDPLQASYFTKVNESLFDKKTEEMLDLLKSMDGAVQDILRHVECPMIMDLLLKIISLERTESGQGIVEWLYTQNVMSALVSFLSPEHSWATQTSAADFIKAIITVSANASQNEQACIGPNELTRQLVSKPCVEQLIKYMLGGGNPLTCGVGIVIEVIRKNNSDYDPEGVDINAPPSSRDPIYLGTLLRLFAEHVPDFMNLILNAPAQNQHLSSTFGNKIEPLGFDRFKTCELMAELLHCSNMMLLNEQGAEELIAARDAQRHRLRAEGQLLPVSNREPAPAEDLSMRVSQSSAPEQGRKLEVMNATVEDDGFEEVSHAADEDNTHGVVELPDAPAQPPAPLVDRDDEEFVDEPLTSPNPGAHDPAVTPHPPSKEGVETPGRDEAMTDIPATGSAVEGPQSQSEETPERAQDLGTQEPEQTVKTGSTPPVSEGENADNKIGSAAPVEADSTAHGEIQPRPEDIPAPLFSRENSQSISGEPSSSAEGASGTTVTASPEQDPRLDQAKIEDSLAPQPAQPGGDSSVATGDAAEPAPSAPAQPKPVVGDFLKMQFVEYRVVPTILSFFFRYPWNNFLHNVVYDIVQQVFNGPMDRGYNPTLAISLFEAADITNQIIKGQLASEKSQAESKTRMGYMGHLTLIAEEVVKFTERHPPELLSEVVLEKVMAPEWVNYVEGALAETRERDNAILGGVRPEVAMNRAGGQGLMGGGFSGLSSIGLGGGASSALADAGLNGGSDVAEGAGGGGMGPFSISSGTLMSGFGSSSDEDDDEEQDTEEDVNNEFRAYTDPLNANHNSMDPPSIPPPPPPPPPLNIPPSRARLQLAARLAMNKKNAAAAAASNGGQEGSSPPTADDATGSGVFRMPNTSASERLRNPFADYEDDDDDNSGSGSSDGEPETVEGEESLGLGTGNSTWHRGSWWRDVVRGSRGRRRRSGSRDEGDAQDMEIERFGDGRDDDSSDEESGRRLADDDYIEDEEFGDFAMPEVEERTTSSTVSGIDPFRKSILHKPTAVHPTASTIKSSGISPFSSLWPFSREKKEGEEAATVTTKSQESNASAPAGSAQGNGGGITEEPVELAEEEEEKEAVIGEDGKKIDRAVEATRRTSIEDPDEDEVDVGEEMIVHRGAGVQ
ncbi:SIT4 phosphatase-associated protein-domain-containing protein [Thermothelomyces heterothallicus CBS 202.75]|uniref:SIT4 phosphatase-associated protein-domain-containing protein n=1 Tax=Thermothelomyces heterothallicus CBS 202.75 TaxID=1149848 RepID=UPI0037449412